MKLYVGENLRRLRTERGLTQESLAERLGVSFQSVSRWETDQSYPDVEMIPEIAAFFEVTTDELMGVDKAVMEKRLHRDWDKVNRMNSNADRLAMLREMRRKYPHDNNVLHNYIVALSHFPEDLKEMRELAEDYLRMPNVDGWSRQRYNNC